MCGRYTLTSQNTVVEELQLSIREPIEAAAATASVAASEWWRPRFNICPTQPAPVVPNREGPRRLEMMRWGLMPPWAKDLSEGARRINARVETAATNRAFRDALRRRRCLVLADGFFEWQGEKQQRLPFYFHPEPRRLVTFAGLWERWKAPDDSWLISFTILTGPPNALVRAYHDRMPLVVADEHRAQWLAPDELTPDELAPILAPWQPDDWQITPVSQHVNRPQHDDPECVAPLDSSPH